MKKVLSRIALVTLIIRFAYFLQHIASPFFARLLLDQHYYDLCARQLAGAGGDMIDGFRPLLYPLFLSAFYALDLDSGMIFSIIAQHILGVGMTVMVAWLAMRMFGNTRAGIVAGLLFCFSAPPLYFEGELLIATLFSFLLLLLWIVVFQALESSTSRRAIVLWLVSGMVMGLAAQARPNALPLLLFFPLLALFRLVQSTRKADRMSAIHCRQDVGDTASRTADILSASPASPTISRLAWHPLLALLGLLLIQSAFGLVNAKYSGSFSLMTQAGGINLYLGNSQKADGMIPRQSRHVVYEGKYRDPIQVMAEQGYREASGKIGTLSPTEVSNYWKEKAIEEIQNDPARWLGLMARKSWLMLWSHEVPNNRSLSFAASQETPMLLWLPVRWWLLLALLPWGLAALIKKGRHELVLWSLSFLVLFSGTVVLFFVNSRFRIPLWPGLAILGGGGATYLWSSLKTRHFPPTPIIFSVALLLLSAINWFGIPPDPIENDLSMRASAYYDQGRYEEALPDILECIKIAPNNPRYHFVFGNILLAQEKPDIAIRAYLKALSLDPTDPMFHNNIGIAFEETGDPEKAMVAYQKAQELRPGHRAARTNQLLLAIQTDRLTLATSILEQIPPEDRNHASLQCAQLILRYKETGEATFLSRAEAINTPLAEQLTRSK